MNKIKIDYKKELNKEQLDVIFNNNNASLVLAGPGSGKTRVLVYRVAYLIEQGVNPENILLLTFTNKAAKNMLNRVESLLGYYPKGLNGGTFHHIGCTLLKKHSPVVGFSDGFSIIDTEDSRQIINNIITRIMPKKDRDFPKSSVIFPIISFCKNTGILLNEYLKEKRFNKTISEAIINISNLYEKNKQTSHLMDFDDLLIYWNKLLEKDSLREHYSNKFKYILVDEFQDTNKIQFEIIKKLSSLSSLNNNNSNQNNNENTNSYNNIMVVGDDCQSIYSFRGAEIKNILDFPKHYKNSKEFRLEINYRSTPEIINLINKSIENNKEQFKKKLQPANLSKNMPYLVHCANTEQEAEFVCKKILDLKKAKKNNFQYSEIGILFRADYQSAQLEMELIKRNIPYKKRGGLKFFEQAHIKDTTAFLKVFNNSKDELAWKRILCLFHGIGNLNVQKIWDNISKCDDKIQFIKNNASLNCLAPKANSGWLEFRKIIVNTNTKTLSPAKTIQDFIDDFYKEYIKQSYPNYKERILDIDQYVNLASRYGNVENFLEDITLDADLTASEGEENKSEDNKNNSNENNNNAKYNKSKEGYILLSTIHQAKGLEWDTVFVISVADNRFPLERAYRDDTLEEERRLFYVACSRAKNNLYLCAPMEEYTFWNGNQSLEESIFIEELPESVYEEINLEE